MPQIETKNEKVQEARWAAPLPRSAIELCDAGAHGADRKKLPWQSHVIDLAKMEHATPEYQSINPNGLVPTLIHDGRTYIESIDIIQYLDGLAAMPSLSPVDPKEQADCRSLTVLADGAQVALKTLTYEFLFAGVAGIWARRSKGNLLPLTAMRGWLTSNAASQRVTTNG